MLNRGIQILMISAFTQTSLSFVNLAVPIGRCCSLARSPVFIGVRTIDVPSRANHLNVPLQMKVELEPEETVKKYGLEAGLFQAFKEGRKGGEEGGSGAATTAKDLLKRYGSAYLITSITFALISFSICFLAVSNGVDISSLLGKLGIETSTPAETTGTVAVAYAIHKAASPIRFPPTVALTPVVAKFMGKDDNEAVN